MLEEHGHRVTAANNAEDALELLAGGHHFDILITDFKLPGMNGRDLIQKARLQKIPCSTVLLSGFVDAMGLSEANTGADVVLQKSAQEIVLLLRAVKTLLKRKKPPQSDSGETPAPAAPRKKA